MTNVQRGLHLLDQTNVTGHVPRAVPEGKKMGKPRKDQREMRSIVLSGIVLSCGITLQSNTIFDSGSRNRNTIIEFLWKAITCNLYVTYLHPIQHCFEALTDSVTR